MKAKFYLLAGLSVIMLGACSDDDLGSDNTGNNTPVEGEGVMHLNLNFPGMNADTRAMGDQGFEEGTDTESKVNDATVYYFDASSNYLGQATTTNIISGPGDGTNTESTLVVQVPANVVKDVTGNKYANIIVVLNKPEGFYPGKTNDTYANFNAALETTEDHAGFMMSSVNYYPNSTETYFTQIKENNIKEEGEAVGNDAVEVWVERVCAKVKLKVENPDTENKAKVEPISWGLNVRNKTVYPVKKLDESFTKLQADDINVDTYWPGANDWTHDDAVQRHRSYWAKDPNYMDSDNYVTNSSTETYPFKRIKFSELDNKTGETALYCLENTFDQDHQDRDETTTAVLLAQYIPTSFQENGTLPDAGDKTWVEQNGLYYTLTTYVNNFLAQQNIYVLENNADPKTYKSATKDDVTFKYDEDTDADGLIGAKNFSFAAKSGTTVYKKVEGVDSKYLAYADANWTALNTAFNSYMTGASIYVNGYCYYEIPIRHFKDHEVKLPEDYDGTYTVAQLGRYGVVRNHCYELTVTKVLKPGKPIPGKEEPIVPEEGPDDPTKEHNITVKINVLQWAVRQHDIEL